MKKCLKGVARRKHWSLDPKLSMMLQCAAHPQPKEAPVSGVPAKAESGPASTSAEAKAAKAVAVEAAAVKPKSVTASSDF